MLDTILGDNVDIKRMQSLAARALFRVGISANVATIAAAVTGTLAAIAFGRGSTMLGIVALAISAGLDAIDGTIARECGTPSALGGVLDLTSDRIVEILVIIAIAWHDPALFFPALLLVGSWYVNITIFLAVGAAIERHGPKLIDYPPGLLERRGADLFRGARGGRGDYDFASARSVSLLRDDRAGNCNRRAASAVWRSEASH